MRLPLIAAASLAVAAPLPALAQDAQESPLAAAVEAMDDPAMQEQVGLMAAMLVGAMMEMEVGPLMQAAAEMSGEEASPVDRRARVRDLLGPDLAADAPARVAERVPQMMGAMATMAGAFERMLPELRSMAERLPADLPRRLPETE